MEPMELYFNSRQGKFGIEFIMGYYTSRCEAMDSFISMFYCYFQCNNRFHGLLVPLVYRSTF